MMLLTRRVWDLIIITDGDSMLEIQRYISQFKSIKDANDFLRKIFRLRIEPQLLVFDNGMKEVVYLYNNSPISPRCTITSEANALILNKSNEIVSARYKKFYEYDERKESNINLSRTRIEMFYDGASVTIFKYKGKMFIQTKHRVMGDNMISYKYMDSFRGYVSGVLYKSIGKGYEDIFDNYKCYTFVLVSPLTKNIVSYKETDLILISIFDKANCKELPKWDLDRLARPDFDDPAIFSRPKTVFINNVYDIRNHLDYEDKFQPGFIIIDDANNRAKYTRSLYKAINCIKNSIDLNALDFAEAILAGMYTDLEKMELNFSPVYDVLQDCVEKIANMLNVRWGKLSRYAGSFDKFCDELNKYGMPKEYCEIIHALRRATITSATQRIGSIKPESLVEYAINYCPNFEENCRECGVVVDVEIRKSEDTSLQTYMRSKC